MISVNDISMRFRLVKNNSYSLKSYVVSLFKNELSYQTIDAVLGVSFEIQQGEIVGIIGRNGAGKSTLLKLICGVLKPTSGTIAVSGNIAPMLELGACFDPDLTGKENVYLNGAILGYSRSFIDSKYDEIVEFSELKEFMDVHIKSFSSGMTTRLAFAISTLVQPEILIVDEILSVGDAHFQTKSEKKMREMMSGGTTVLIVSHSLNQIRELSSRVIWMEHGRVRMDGKTEEVCAAYEKSVV